MAFDFLEGDTDVSDIPGPVTGHGTLTAGNVVALDNDIGTVGVAPEAKVLPYRVCDAAVNVCLSSWIIGGIDRAITDGADVISMSFGGRAASIGERVVIRRAFLEGIVLVASSGNAGRPPVNFPAALPEVIAVGATDEANRLAGFSSFGHGQELVAPGVDVPSTFLSGEARDALLRQTAPGDPALLTPIPMQFTIATDADGETAPLAFAGLATDADVASLDLTGKIALIQRGSITFKEKVENVASKGALGAVIYNNVAGDLAGTLQTPSTIPAVGITMAEGLGLKAQLDAGASVEVQLIVAASSYEEASGTSFSAPHVSGVAALVVAANGDLSGLEVRIILDTTATDLGPAGYDRFYGFGLVNAEAAVTAALAALP
jgi:subtilisin family serine protease